MAARILTSLILLCLYNWSNGENPECSPAGTEVQVDQEAKILTSPGYGTGQSLDHVRCMWVLRGPEDKYVEIDIQAVQLKDESLCMKEYLDLVYDDSVSPYLRYCGNIIPGKVVIPLKSNPRIGYSAQGLDDGQEKGFKLQYKIVDTPLECDASSFACSRPFKCIPSTKQCDGKGDCQNGEDEIQCGHKPVQPSKCGIQEIQPDLDRIVGGQVAVEGSWPWLASVQGNYIWPSGHGCGAVILNNLYVLTAAHCVVGRFFKAFRVKFGDYNQYQNEGREITRDLEMFYMHPNYSRFETTDDLAILKLTSPIEYDDYISPICLPEPGENLADETLLYAIGWGATEKNSNSEVIRQVAVPTIAREKCEGMVFRKLPPRTICTGLLAGGKNPCFGDSGGPLMVRKDGRWVVHGVVSWGPTVCGTAGEASVYTKISEHIQWINKIISQ